MEEEKIIKFFSKYKDMIIKKILPIEEIGEHYYRVFYEKKGDERTTNLFIDGESILILPK